jgi:hypothetical protein
MRAGRTLLGGAGLLLLGAGACVPADEALPLGAAQFTVTGRGSGRTLEATVVDGWAVRVDRFILSFQSMTIVNLLDSAQCAYRGRGAEVNTVFDGISGSLVQAFNGILPGDCPDVGLRLAPPDARFVLGEGATVADVVELASGAPAHALFEATATRASDARVLRLRLRFDTARTSRSFGDCRDAIRGTKIRPAARDAVFVAFAAEAFFRDAVSRTAQLRVDPFFYADLNGDADGRVTMEELDRQPLASFGATFGQFYELPGGLRTGSFGDYVRAQFAFALDYGKGGFCVGIAPGTEDNP